MEDAAPTDSAPADSRARYVHVTLAILVMALSAETLMNALRAPISALLEEARNALTLTAHTCVNVQQDILGVALVALM